MVEIICHWCGDDQRWPAVQLDRFVVSCRKCEARAWVTDHLDEGRVRLWEQLIGRGWRDGEPTPAVLEREVEFFEVPPVANRPWQIIWARRRKAVASPTRLSVAGTDTR